jgi:hypothetical protein
MIILRKGVSLGLGAITGSAPWQTFQNNAGFYGPQSSGGTNTNWTRIWADWPTLQPAANTPLGVNFAPLDSQIQAANAAGKYVILVARGTPTWAGSTTDEPTGVKTKEYRVPNDLTSTGPWAQFIKFLLLRYSGTRMPIWCLEVCNEPNYEMWPQRLTQFTYGDGALAIGCLAAAMLETAQAIHDGLGLTLPLLLAPATSDNLTDSVERTSYSVFMQAMLSTLQGANFVPGPYTAWSHHNYNDVEQNRSGTPAQNPSYFCLAQDARHRLQQAGWTGWNPQTGETPPMVWLTEGGARWPKIQSYYGPGLNNQQLESWQNNLLIQAHSRLQIPPDGAGMALFMNYLFYTDPNFDTGLLYQHQPPPAAPQFRSAYTTWGGFPNP